MYIQTVLAVMTGKLSAKVIESVKKRPSTTLSGKMALKVDPWLLGKLGRQIRNKTVAISGTNGKSTTAGLLAAFMEAGGANVVHNQQGANLLAGITTALVQKTSVCGRLSADYGVIEVDEATLPPFSGKVKQDLTLVTNLFRDQLDRYGELDTTAKFIQSGILQSGGALALNADDPMVTAIGRHFPDREVIYFGVSDAHYPHALNLDFPVSFPREVTDCPVCQAPLAYSKVLYGHLGHYACTACDFKRPTPWLTIDRVEVEASESLITLSQGENLFEPVTLNMPGLFNAYNFLAAATASLWLGLPYSQIPDGLGRYQNLFGRAEKKQIDGKSSMILLIKNPIGATEVLKVVTADPKSRLAIMINDNYADSRDVSWLWDAPFELLGDTQNPIVVSGQRAEDMAVRLKYAGVPESMIEVEPDIMKAFHQGLRNTERDETLYALPTYTALLQLSQALGSRR